MRKLDFHFSMLAVVLFLCVSGVFNLYSASHQAVSPKWLSQIYWLCIGFTMVGAMLFIDYRIFERLAYPLYIFNIVLLALVPLIGPRIYGAHRWLDLGFMKFQPSELMKISIVLVLARYFQEDRNIGGYSLIGLIKPLLLLALPALLIIIEPDLGTTLVVCFIAFSVFMFVKIKWQSILIIAIVGILSVPVAYQFVLKDYQK